MTFTTPLSSGFAAVKNRSSFLSPQSGMCSLCAEDCPGTCEIALAAVRGAQTVYPTTTGNNQIASEKEFGLDWSHFNINGRVFGAKGVAPTFEEAEIYQVKLERTYGRAHPVRLAMPVILPALIKLNWPDYFGGAAMAGVSCVIGEGARNRDPELVIRHGKAVAFPMLSQMLDCFRNYDRGYGQIILQCNVEDDLLGIPELALQHYGAQAIEIKFGQAAKGTQPANRLNTLKEALTWKRKGMLVHPDPDDPAVQAAYRQGVCPSFYKYARLPQWTLEYLQQRIKQLRQLGAKNILFKMAGYDPTDLEQVLRIAVACQVDMVTFDGAGGGSGYSPCHMMNEWGLPVVTMEREVVHICQKLRAEGLALPAITITGGFATEDQVFKALAFGQGEVCAIGICRAAMAAAMTGKKIGADIQSGQLPPMYAKYGSTVQELFSDLPDLRALYGKQANEFSTGAIGVFSYLNKLAFGLQHFGALVRKFDLSLLDRGDLIPLTAQAGESLLQSH